jgi:hypothetical protein
VGTCLLRQGIPCCAATEDGWGLGTHRPSFSCVPRRDRFTVVRAWVPSRRGQGGLLIYTLAAVRLLLFLASRSWVGALAAAVAIVLLPVVIYTRDG